MTEPVRLSNPGETVDTLLTTVQNSNLSATHKITRSATLVVAASDSSAKSKAQADYVCDGTDDQVEIQAAIDSISTIGGKIQLLEGTFLLDAPYDFYVNNSKYSICLEGSNIEFAGMKGTVLKLKDGINLGTGTNTFAATLILNGSNLSVHDITFNNNYSYVTANWNVAIWHGTSDTNSPAKSCTSHFVDISKNKFIRQRKWAIWGDGGLSSYWNVHHNMVTPLSQENGIGFHNGPAGSQMCNNIIASESGSTINIGLFIDSISNILIANNFIKKPKAWGIEAYDIVNTCAIRDNIIEGNGAETARAIRLHTKNKAGSANNNNIVEGNIINDVPIGIKIDDAYVIGTVIRNNHFEAVDTPISDGGTDTRIYYNSGYATESTGTATITTGQTTVEVTHGLAAAPTRVIISPTTATGGRDFYVSAKGATTFTITIDSPAEADAEISFDWQAMI